MAVPSSPEMPGPLWRLTHNRDPVELRPMDRSGADPHCGLSACGGGQSPGMSYGGYKQSGIGREMGMHAAELYTELKNIYFSEL